MTLVERRRRSGPVRTHTASTTRSAGTFSAHARCSFYSSFAGTACRGCERRVYPNKLAVLRGQLDSHDRQAFIRALLRLNGNQGDGPETPFSMVPLQPTHVQPKMRRNAAHHERRNIEPRDRFSMITDSEGAAQSLHTTPLMNAEQSDSRA